MELVATQINELGSNSLLLAFLQKSLFGIKIPNYILEHCTATEWTKVYNEASIQAVTALALQGLLCFPKECLPPVDLLREWQDQVFKVILSNERLVSEQTEVLKILNNANINAAVLKGTSSSRFYPKPELRELGDIDLLINPHDMDRAILAMEKNGFHKIEDKHAFHVSLSKKVHVELHRAISRFDDDIGFTICKAVMDAFEQTEICTLDNARFPCLSPFHNALVLLLHMERHMKDCGIGLRHLCDWAMYVNANERPDLWSRLLLFLKEIGLYTFAEVVTKACVIYLGLSQDKCAWCSGADPELCARVIQEILESGNFGRKTGPERGTSSYMASGFIRKLNRSVRKCFPVCEKYSILLPLFWLYIPIRYIIRMLTGKRPKQSALKVANLARKRKKLFRDLCLRQ